MTCCGADSVFDMGGTSLEGDSEINYTIFRIKLQARPGEGSGKKKAAGHPWVMSGCGLGSQRYYFLALFNIRKLYMPSSKYTADKITMDRGG